MPSRFLISPKKPKNLDITRKEIEKIRLKQDGDPANGKKPARLKAEESKRLEEFEMVFFFPLLSLFHDSISDCCAHTIHVFQLCKYSLTAMPSFGTTGRGGAA